MNPMIAALQKSRADAPAPAPAPGGPGDAPAAPDAGPGDALLQKLAEMDAKLDKVMASVCKDENEAPGKSPALNDGKEAAPNDDGY